MVGILGNETVDTGTKSIDEIESVLLLGEKQDSAIDALSAKLTSNFDSASRRQRTVHENKVRRQTAGLLQDFVAVLCLAGYLDGSIGLQESANTLAVQRLAVGY
jgi:hypothetical protein